KDRGKLFHSVVGHLYAQGLSEEEIRKKFEAHPGGVAAKFTDKPGRLAREVRRSFRKWQHEKQARVTGQPPSLPPPPTGGSPPPPPPPGTPPPPPQPQTWPSIRIVAGELPRVVDEAESALIASGHELYQRAGLIVRPVLSALKAAHDRDTLGWRLVPLNAQHTIELMTRSARFYKWERKGKGKFVVTDAPLKIAETYLAREGIWKLPILTGIVNAPFLRADGSLCDRPGYDAVTGLVFKPNGVSFPRIPPNPNRGDALAAFAVLSKPIETFPFVTNADRSVALSGILTPLDRHALATAP